METASADSAAMAATAATVDMAEVRLMDGSPLLLALLWVVAMVEPEALVALAATAEPERAAAAQAAKGRHLLFTPRALSV